MYSTSSILFEDEEQEKNRQRCKKEGCYKLLGFLGEFHHFYGNLHGNLGIVKFPEFPTFGGNSTKIAGFFGHPYHHQWTTSTTAPPPSSRQHSGSSSLARLTPTQYSPF